MFMLSLVPSSRPRGCGHSGMWFFSSHQGLTTSGEADTGEGVHEVDDFDQQLLKAHKPLRCATGLGEAKHVLTQGREPACEVLVPQALVESGVAQAVAPSVAGSISPLDDQQLANGPLMC